MSDEQWYPLGMDNSAERAEFTAAVEGFDGQLGRSAFGWVARQFEGYKGVLKTRLAEELVLRLKLDDVVVKGYPDDFVRAVMERVRLERLVDYTLAFVDSAWADQNALRVLLEQGRSVWEVGRRAGRAGLVRRVSESFTGEAQRAVEHVAAEPHLVAAWDALYGVEPDFGRVCLEAAKAVEAAYGPVFEPKNQDRTGSSINGVMRRGTSTWEVVSRFEDSKRPTQEMVLGMLATVWALREGAHAATEGKPAGRKREEATLSFTLAVALVNLVESGVVASVSGD